MVLFDTDISPFEQVNVALDLETTGLDSSRHAIMEIGAVRFDEHGASETFQSFVRPAEPIPYRIRLLTNIEQADVDNAPAFDDVQTTPPLTPQKAFKAAVEFI